MKKYTVVAAIIENEGQILCMQRDKSKYDYVSYKFEFPGGKIEDGETQEEALCRELVEEMNINASIKKDDFYMTVEHDYPDFSITMHCYNCHVKHRNFKKNVHIAHKWLDISKLNTLDWAAADIPIVNRLQGEL